MPPSTFIRLMMLLLGGGLLAAGCWSSGGEPAEPSQAALPRAASTSPRKLTSRNLPNPVQVHPEVISGGLPEGDAAFQELAQRGIRTIISVDGMTPDVATAARHGLRYVHLPHGYDGIAEARARELAKALRDLPGPFYIHCHHGKHRSPAAASVACVLTGRISSEEATSILELAGTDPGYRGLYQSVRQATVLEDQELSDLVVSFQATVQIPPLAEAMVQLDMAWHHLERVAQAGWQSPADHPDLDPRHEALLLGELFTELLRSPEVSQQPQDFRNWLLEAETCAYAMEAELQLWQTDSPSAPPPARLESLRAQISQGCKACHVRYRDLPPHLRQVRSPQVSERADSQPRAPCRY